MSFFEIFNNLFSNFQLITEIFCEFFPLCVVITSSPNSNIHSITWQLMKPRKFHNYLNLKSNIFPHRSWPPAFNRQIGRHSLAKYEWIRGSFDPLYILHRQYNLKPVILYAWVCIYVFLRRLRRFIRQPQIKKKAYVKKL